MYDEQELVGSGLYTSKDPKLSVDNVLTAFQAVSFHWTQCIQFARQAIADHLREMSIQSICFLNNNDTYVDLTPTEECIAPGRDILLLRKMDSLQFSDYFTDLDQLAGHTTGQCVHQGHKEGCT